MSKTLTAAINNSRAWKGADADEMRDHWNGTMRLQLRSASKSLNRASTKLLNEANQQQEASGGRGSGAGPGKSAQPIEGRKAVDPLGPNWMTDPDSPFRSIWTGYGFAK